MTTLLLSPMPLLRTYDNSGNLAIGGKIYTYVAQTSTPIATYTDSGAMSMNTNPIILDSRGECQIWVDPTLSYRYEAFDINNVPLWTQDNITCGFESEIGPPPPPTPTLTQDSISGRNRLINGDFLINTRSNLATRTVLVTTPAYVAADRWFSYQSPTAAGIFTSMASPAGAGRTYIAKLGRTNGSALTGVLGMGQVLETIDSTSLAGQSVIFSFYAKAGANFSANSNALHVNLYTGTGTDESSTAMVNATWSGYANPISQTATLTTTMTRYYYVVTLASSVTQVGIQLSYTATGTAGADDNIYVADVQLEQAFDGAITPTEYARVSAAQSQTLCARYYQQIVMSADVNASGANVPAFASQSFYPMRRVANMNTINQGIFFATVNVPASSTVGVLANACYAVRLSIGAGVAQFSELFQLDAEL